jgi:hypothetical protein
MEYTGVLDKIKSRMVRNNNNASFRENFATGVTHSGSRERAHKDTMDVLNMVGLAVQRQGGR